MAKTNPVVEENNQTGRWPYSIFEAARRDDVEMAEKALAGGQSFNDLNGGSTPLHIAASLGSTKFIKRASQDPSADPWVFDHHGRTPFMYAAMRKDTENKLILSDMMDRTRPLPDFDATPSPL